MTVCTHEKAIKGWENGPVKLIMPTKGAYTGAYVDFGDGEGHVILDAIEGF
ncbi:MAG: hypothetical protein ACUVQ6_06600 [Dissulfurimicrobium sp.]|uniref:hypothetical protein n=1 Tax=Dissulfurimicrobium sp. TaxID=2022436 RepID=UPI00404ADEA8